MNDVADTPPLAYYAPEAAKRLGVPVRTLRKMCETGELFARKRGAKWLIPHESIERYLAGEPQRQPVDAPRPRQRDRIVPFSQR